MLPRCRVADLPERVTSGVHEEIQQAVITAGARRQFDSRVRVWDSGTVLGVVAWFEVKPLYRWDVREASSQRAIQTVSSSGEFVSMLGAGLALNYRYWRNRFA